MPRISSLALYQIIISSHRKCRLSLRGLRRTNAFISPPANPRSNKYTEQARRKRAHCIDISSRFAFEKKDREKEAARGGGEEKREKNARNGLH